MTRKIFVNLPVKDLEASKEFFTRIGFSLDEQFTDENASCVVITENIYAMLLVEPFFQRFSKKEVVDARSGSETILALTADSREAVDELAERAAAAGAAVGKDPADQGFMYTRSFEDLDGHLWEIFWMDPATVKS